MPSTSMGLPATTVVALSTRVRSTAIEEVLRAVVEADGPRARWAPRAQGRDRAAAPQGRWDAARLLEAWRRAGGAGCGAAEQHLVGLFFDNRLQAMAKEGAADAASGDLRWRGRQAAAPLQGAIWSVDVVVFPAAAVVPEHEQIVLRRKVAHAPGDEVEQDLSVAAVGVAQVLHNDHQPGCRPCGVVAAASMVGHGVELSDDVNCVARSDLLHLTGGQRLPSPFQAGEEAAVVAGQVDEHRPGFHALYRA